MKLPALVHSLRGRITTAFFFGALLLSVLVMSASDFFSEDMEHTYAHNRLTENMTVVLEQFRSGREVQLPFSNTMRAYSYVRGGRTLAPLPLTELAPGIHEVEVDLRELQVLVTDEGNTRFVLSYDTAQLEAIEDRLHNWLLMGLVLVVGIATIYGYWMSSRIVRPITNLANAIDGLEGERNVLPPDQGGDTDDEVARLARAFRAYTVRLQHFIERERHFTADVSHELRNPIMAASNAVELLQRRSDFDERTRGQVMRIRRSLERMHDLVHLFLSLAREPETDREADTALSFDLVEVVTTAVENHRAPAQTKGLELALDVKGQPRASGDRAMASVVIENLIANAIQYTGVGQVHVVVSESGVDVLDSGPGMRETDPAKLVERQTRGRQARDAHPAGSGLGLAIVTRLCDHQGWSFTLTSPAGRGTHASFVLRPAQTEPLQ